jgi:4-aminobutyrate aminotransferase/(S)-3-amino-2-methylpropionate transaminase
MGKSIQLKTTIPGPKSMELLNRRQQSVPKGVANAGHVFVDKAEGALLTDIDGNTFIDFAGAIGTINVGHRPPHVVARLHQQIDQYLHTCFHVMMYEPYIELAEKLAEITPGSFHKKTILLNSGAEAVENAVKIARKYTGRTGIVSFNRGFHGRTLLGMSLTSKVKPYKFGFGPFAPATYKAMYPYPYHRPEGMSEEAYSQFCVRQLEDFFLSEAPPEEIAAVILEPVQGEGGFIVPPTSFIHKVAEICKKHGILLIADEIQTGFGRTGTMFAMERFGVVPDLITLSKSMAAGLPISAVVGRAEVMDAANPGELGGTYGGSPLGCAAALGVIDIMERERLPERAERIGTIMMDRFQQMKDRYEIIGDVRGLGAMTAIEFVEDRQTKTPAKTITAEIQQECYRQGVVSLSAGVYSNVLRFLAPLVITDEQLEEGLDVLERVIERANVSLKGTQAIS